MEGEGGGGRKGQGIFVVQAPRKTIFCGLRSNLLAKKYVSVAGKFFTLFLSSVREKLQLNLDKATISGGFMRKVRIVCLGDSRQ